MSVCSKCGAELAENAAFCTNCGAAVSTAGRVRSAARSSERKRQEACFGPRGSGGGLWGAISFGVFLIGLAILLIFDIFWPGILFLIALLMIIGALVAYSRR